MDLEIKNAINNYYLLKSDYEKFIVNNKYFYIRKN